MYYHFICCGLSLRTSNILVTTLSKAFIVIMLFRHSFLHFGCTHIKFLRACVFYLVVWIVISNHMFLFLFFLARCASLQLQHTMLSRSNHFLASDLILLFIVVNIVPS
uniref:Uncharacterized protein n=1 Tax=Schizaphis graminum TaxID=13262 RepID=A0A2S2NJD9_SCHGA